MEVQHHQEGNKGKFYVKIDGQQKAEMTYVFAGEDKIIIDHTEVDESLKGQGIGYQLIEKAVEFVKEKGIKILPLCPFAKHALEKEEKYHEIIF